MGATTPNIGLYIPADGETNYGTAFANGMLNLDTHDHSGSPNKGVPISSSGIADGSITAVKLASDVVSPSGGLSFDINNALQTDGVLKAIFNIGSNGLIVRLSPTTAASRSIDSASVNQITVTNADGVAGNPTIGIPSAFIAPGTVTAASGDITATNGDLVIQGASKGIKLPTGSNATMGTMQLTNGYAIVPTTAFNNNVKTFLSRTVKDTSTAIGELIIDLTNPGTDFRVMSVNSSGVQVMGDQSFFEWLLIKF